MSEALRDWLIREESSKVNLVIGLTGEKFHYMLVQWTVFKRSRHSRNKSGCSSPWLPRGVCADAGPPVAEEGWGTLRRAQEGTPSSYLLMVQMRTDLKEPSN